MHQSYTIVFTCGRVVVVVFFFPKNLFSSHSYFPSSQYLNYNISKGEYELAQRMPKEQETDFIASFGKVVGVLLIVHKIVVLR